MNLIAGIIMALTTNVAPLPNTEVVDLTEVSTEPLYNTFADEELAGAGPVVITWAESVTVASAMVPYSPSRYPECAGAPRCIIVSQEWWEMSKIWWGIHAVDARRVLMAHEFGHVLSIERKETDLAYAKAVARVHEECLADAVATYVLARGNWPASKTENYDVSYQCDDFWMTNYGEDRSAEAMVLAEDLLRWAVYRWEPVVEEEPITDIGTPPVPGVHPTDIDVAVATTGATREVVHEPLEIVG